MARVFAYLMQPNVALTEDAIFEDVSSIIKNALIESHKENNSPLELQKVALGIAMKKLN
jgi:hypothetical protein